MIVIMVIITFIKFMLGKWSYIQQSITNPNILASGLTVQQLYFIQSLSVMFKLWRREANKNVAPDLANKRKEAQFMEHLSQAIKIVRKKQQFYTRIVFIEISPFAQTTYAPHTQTYARISFNLGVRQHTSYSGFGNSETITPNDNANSSCGVDVWRLQNQIQSLVSEEDEIVTNLKQYEQDSFFLSKKFLYSMFVRLLEIFQFAKQSVLLKVKNDEKVYCRNWEKLYQDNKLALTDCYQNLVYFQNFNVLELTTLALKKQNHRIFSIVPTRVKKNQIALKPLIRISSTELRKTHSVEMKPKKDEIAEIINKKLSIKEKKLLFTQKRIQQRKKAKEKPITMKNLYGIMNIKIPKIEEGLAYRRQMESDALQRNELIQEQRKKWQKRCEQRHSSMKSINQ